MRGRRAFPASTVPRKPQQQKMRICSIAKGPLKERAFLLAYEMASGNLKHCARVGRDHVNVHTLWRLILFQSTRPRGARRDSPKLVSVAGEFQSTRPRGARPLAVANLATRSMFQSTRPRGARRGRCWIWSIACWFQSTRPRGARRLLELGQLTDFHVSIHAPARGATPHPRGSSPGRNVSIHAPARGATFPGMFRHSS